jgi:hypothetical protein
MEVHRHPLSTLEVRRILLEHLQQVQPAAEHLLPPVTQYHAADTPELAELDELLR